MRQCPLLAGTNLSESIQPARCGSRWPRAVVAGRRIPIAPRRVPARAAPAPAAASTRGRPSSPTATPSAHPVITPITSRDTGGTAASVVRPVRGEGGPRPTSSQPSTGGVPQPARGREKSPARDTSHDTKQRLSERPLHVAALPPQTAVAASGSSGRCCVAFQANDADPERRHAALMCLRESESRA